MDSREWTRKPEWMDETRREPRWQDVRTLVARWGEEECLGKTRDVSLRGLGVALKGAVARIGDPVSVDVVFEGEVVEFRGRVAHSRPEPWGSLAGVLCDEDDPQRAEFLHRRYAADLSPG